MSIRYTWILKIVVCLCVFFQHTGILFSQVDTTGRTDELLLYTKDSTKIKITEDTTVYKGSRTLDEVIPADSVQPHSPQKAVMYSAVLPGLGQIYNKQYWKVPVVYAGFATLFYFAIVNSEYYNNYLKGYLAVHNNELDDPVLDDLKYYQDYKQRDNIEDILREVKEDFRRNRDLSYFGIVGWYILNIVDAQVSAYFLEYDISKDLSLKIDPEFQNFGNRENNYAMGISLKFNF
jgi:hypothetical protein